MVYIQTRNKGKIIPYNPRSKLAEGLAYIGKLSPKARNKYKAWELYQTHKYTQEDLALMFEKNKSTISRWIAQVEKAKQIRRYQYLEYKSTKPHNTPRKKKRGLELKDKIKAIRSKYKCGKTKISKYLKRDYQITASPSTCQREINTWKPSEDPKNSTTVKVHTVKKRNKALKRIKDVLKDLTWKPKERFQIDTKFWVINGVRLYIIAAIDVVTRMVFARAYSRHTSNCAKDFLERLIYLYELQPDSEIQVYFQRDNGSEFQGEFEDAAHQNNIILLTNYVRTPEMNAYVERFNKTLKEELLEYYLPSSVSEANELLSDWIIQYNFQRIHEGLDYRTPFEEFAQQTFKIPIQDLTATYFNSLHLLWSGTKAVHFGQSVLNYI